MSEPSLPRGPSAGAASVAAAVLLAGLSGCGGPSGGCAAIAWEGRCTLGSVGVVEEAEFPAPHIVVEAIYTPQKNTSFQQFTPGPVSIRRTARAAFEADLRQHFENHRDLPCRLNPPPLGECYPGDVTLKLPDFVAPAQAYGFGDRRLRGCAQLEAGGGALDLASIGGEGTPLLQTPLVFGAGQSSLAAKGRERIAAAAEELLAAPDIECVAIVGQAGADEPATLAADRARSVKAAFLAAGVEDARLMPITATVSVYGPDAQDRPRDAELRRAFVRIVLRTSTPRTQP